MGEGSLCELFLCKGVAARVADAIAGVAVTAEGGWRSRLEAFEELADLRLGRLVLLLDG